MVESFGSGVAWIDVDNDGYPDLFFVNGAPGSSNALYHNNKDGTFTDVTRTAGVAGTAGGRRGDVQDRRGRRATIDNDGYLDLYVTALGPNTLYRNNGNGTFTDVTAAAGVAGGSTEWSTSTGFFDFDHDGDLDLYVANYLDYTLADNPYCGFQKPGFRMYCSPTMFDGMADRLFRNNGNGTFTDVSQSRRHRESGGQGAGRHLLRRRRRWPTGRLRRQRPGAQLPLPQQRQRHVPRHGLRRRRRASAQTASPRPAWASDCGGRRRRRAARPLRDELRGRVERALPQQRRRNLSGRRPPRPACARACCRSASARGSSIWTTTATCDMYVANGHIIDNVAAVPADVARWPEAPALRKRRRRASATSRRRAAPALQLERVSAAVWRSPTSTTTGISTWSSPTRGRPPCSCRTRDGQAGMDHHPGQRDRKSNRFGLGSRVEIEAGGTTAGRRDQQRCAATRAAMTSDCTSVSAVATTISRLTFRWPAGADPDADERPGRIGSSTVEEP